ncbi:hypothetical protein HDV00_001394 [Rhizophlyctis rosea]|nr:hypothetical protein HDV00_001394 [Rhizophlyctis rosea]
MAQQAPPPGSLPPSRSARSKCWKARDLYFACLEENGLWLQGLKPLNYEDYVKIDPTNPPVRPENALSRQERKELYACKQMKEAFDWECLPSWVSHFSMLRVKDLQMQHLKKKLENEEQQRATNDADFWQKVSAKPESNTSSAA